MKSLVVCAVCYNLILCSAPTVLVSAFSLLPSQKEVLCGTSSSSLLLLHYSNRDQQYLGSNNNNNDDDDDTTLLQHRIDALKLQHLEQELQRPPTPHLSCPQDFIHVLLLHCLQSCDDPFPDAGFRRLLRSSTAAWRRQLYASVGATSFDDDDDSVATALGEAMRRPATNQFGLLLLRDSYVPVFPSEPVDYMGDGTCWVECQLRCRETDTLLVITGWQLEQEDGCWMIDRIDWQDFRDGFRPGIGREEWIRICG